MQLVVNLMIYLGIVLMLNNIIGYIKYERYVRIEGIWEMDYRILYIPIGLLILFFLGYFGVVLYGKPDIIIASILLGGSIFVFAMLKIMHSVTKSIRENGKLKADLEAAGGACFRWQNCRTQFRTPEDGVYLVARTDAVLQLLLALDHEEPRPAALAGLLLQRRQQLNLRIL